MTASGGRSGISRRQFLQATAASSLILASCGPGRTLEGSIVGASHQKGHLLRGGSIPKPSRTIDTGIAILGGGIAGLSAAWKLRRSGFEDFQLFELESEVGGNSRFGANSASAYPWGAHYVPLPTADSTAVRELFRELGVITGDDSAGRPIYDERYLCQAPQERLFIHGRWQEGLFPTVGAQPQDLAQYKSFRDRMSAFRAAKAFRIPLVRSVEDPELDRISMKAWMEREGFTSERLRWYVDYCMRDDYGSALDETSAWAGIHYYAAREEDHEVLTWPEGNGWIMRRLAEPVTARTTTGVLVTRVVEEGGAAVADLFDTRSGESFRVRAKRAIFALPRLVGKYALSGCGAEGFSYAPWMVANITVDHVPKGHGVAPAWDNVLYQSPSLGYVVATHQSLRSFQGPSVLTYYRPFPTAERQAMLDRTWEQWVHEIFSDLRVAHPDLPSLASRCDVMLFGHAMIRPTPGFIWGPGRRAVDSFGPIVMAHSDMSGISIFEEAQYQGVRAAERVLKDLGIAFSSSLG